LIQYLIVLDVRENIDLSDRTGGLIYEWSVKAVQTIYSCNKIHCSKVIKLH